MNPHKKKREIHFIVGVIGDVTTILWFCYALRNIFHDRVVKGDLVIKARKRANPMARRHKP